MEHSLTYRTGSINDLERLLELALLSYSQYKEVLTSENWKKLESGLKNEDKLAGLIERSHVFVCENGEEIVGMAYLVPSGNPTHIFDKEWCYIRLVGVHPKYRGRGIARTITSQCISCAKANHETTIALHTSEFMDAARHMYESLGFKKIREIEPIFDKRYWLYGLTLAQAEP